MNNNIILYEQF